MQAELKLTCGATLKWLKKPPNIAKYGPFYPIDIGDDLTR